MEDVLQSVRRTAGLFVKGCARKSAHISCARCLYAPLELSHAVPVAPEVAGSTRMMSLTADLTGKPPNQVDEHRQCSVGDHRGMAVARVEAQTEAVSLQLGRYRHNIH